MHTNSRGDAAHHRFRHHDGCASLLQAASRAARLKHARNRIRTTWHLRRGASERRSADERILSTPWEARVRAPDFQTPAARPRSPRCGGRPRRSLVSETARGRTCRQPSLPLRRRSGRAVRRGPDQKAIAGDQARFPRKPRPMSAAPRCPSERKGRSPLLSFRRGRGVRRRNRRAGRERRRRTRSTPIVGERAAGREATPRPARRSGSPVAVRSSHPLPAGGPQLSG